MHELFVNAVVQAPDTCRLNWAKLCTYWDWGFWVGVAVGIVGAFVLFYFRPRIGS